LIRENFKNIVYQTFAQILPRALLFIFTFYLAATLGSIEYGKYDFSLSIGYLIGVFFELGGNVILTKYVARGFYSSYKYSLKFRIVSILLTFIVVFAVFTITGLHKQILFHILAAAIGIAFSSLMNLNFAFFRGLKKMNYEAVVLIIQKILFIAICLVFLMQTNNSFYSLLSFALSMVISWIIIQWIFIKEHHKYVELNSQNQILFRDYFKDVMSLALVEVFSIIYFRVTQIILEAYSGYSQVGVYGASYKLVEAFTNIPSILMIVLFPGFAKLAVESRLEFKVQFYKVLKLLLLLGIGSSVFCWIFGKPIFSLLGKDYGDSFILVRYMTLALTAIFPNYLLTQSLIALDQNLKYASVLFIVLVLNLGISLLLVPQFGAYGSAISVGICEVIIFAACFYLLNKIFNENAAKT
jgi:O-antigen/teichoic acid export membrane protein